MVTGILITRGGASHCLYMAGMGIPVGTGILDMLPHGAAFGTYTFQQECNYVCDTNLHVMNMKYYVKH